MIKSIDTDYLTRHLLPQKLKELTRAKLLVHELTATIAKIEAELKFRTATGYDAPRPLF